MNRKCKLYEVTQNNKTIMIGTAQEIADKLYTTIWNVRDAVYKKRKFLEKYEVKRHSDGKWERV